MLLELRIIKSSNYKTTRDILLQSTRRKRNSIEDGELSDDSDEESRDALDEDNLILSRAVCRHSDLYARITSIAKKVWNALGIENIILLIIGLGKFTTLVLCVIYTYDLIGVTFAHFSTGDVSWSDDSNLMHLLLGATMLVMGLAGTQLNTHYMVKCTFNFAMALASYCRVL